MVALIDDIAVLTERVRYDAYGRARHRWPADLDGDGDSDSGDHTLQLAAASTAIHASGYTPDADHDRDGDVDTNDYFAFLYATGKSALPLGLITSPAGHTPSNPIGYDGYVFAPEAGVVVGEGGGQAQAVGAYCVRFRWYVPEIGRWLQRDPLGYIEGMHRYVYVGSSPSLVDPKGLYTDPGVPAAVDSRDDPSQGCGIKVRQNDFGETLPSGEKSKGHRWIVIDDPGVPGVRPAGITGVGRYPQGVVSPYGDPPPDCEYCDQDDPATTTPGHTEWDTVLSPGVTYYRPELDDFAPDDFGPQVILVPQPHVLQWGPAAGVAYGNATCEDIRQCIYSFRDQNTLPYTFVDVPPFGSNCRSDVDAILSGCGLKRLNERRTDAGRAIDERNRAARDEFWRRFGEFERGLPAGARP